ncbi:MAG TPA: ATP-binding cassette domain-containing protein [Streptosporangiaceae bacterium]
MLPRQRGRNPAAGRPPARGGGPRPGAWRPVRRGPRRRQLRLPSEGAPLAARARERPPQVLRRVQYVFQNPYTSLNPRKTAGQIVAQPLEQFLRLPYRERSERAARALADVALGGDFLPRYPDQLSGGERQRVAIARALAVEPDLLICDEVTSALDVSVQAVIVELLCGLQAKRRIAMIFITHNLALVRSIAQSAVVLRDGAVVESGPVEQVLERPAHSYTIRLMEDVPSSPAQAGRRRRRVKRRPGGRPSPDPGCDRPDPAPARANPAWL